MLKPIADETIALILKKADIVDVIGEYVHLKKSGRGYVGLCPFHAEKTPSFSVSAEKQLYNCFGCGAGGSIFSFLMEMEGYSFPQSVKYVGERVGISVQLNGDSAQAGETNRTEKEWMIKAHSLSAKLFHHVLLERAEAEPARKYLENRGIRLETIKEFQIGYAPASWDFLTSFLQKRNFPLELLEQAGLITQGKTSNYYDRFRDRIMFPILDSQSQVVAFGGRLLGEGVPKYLNSPESLIFRKSRLLYNFQRSRTTIRNEQTTVLFEGYVDVISAWQAGVTNTIATMGTSLSEEQTRLIRRNSEKVILCYDGDQAGIDAITRAADLLEKQGCIIKIAALPDGLDPDDYIRKFGSEAFQKKVNHESKSFVAFRIEALRRGRNLLDDGERMRYIGEALAVISKLTTAVERDHYLRQLAEEFSLSLDALKQEQYRLYRAEKKKENMDKVDERWNNNKNTGKHLVAKQMFPAFHTAERMLLAHMLHSAEVTKQIQEEIGSNFNIDEHVALATYLYAFHETHSDIHVFISTLQDKELSQLATQLLMLTIETEPSQKTLQDYIYEVLSYPIKKEISTREEEKVRLERQGDAIQAAHLAATIIKMKKQLKKQRENSF
ncbi:DNA primase [Bacillus horti]|uniref:DNA primase n=1 Tax=Caldalkalibacillus horti TaxID=77523 RepID=A0ABT9W4Q8_9BACI|nr:DNA primase [Bacillus horti]MDQ0168062.1 DNA primase [Bacillus horti]